MYDTAALSLEKAFSKEGAKLRFRKLIGLDEVTDEEVDDMVAENDASAFLGHLQRVDQPIYTADWGALWHCNSGRFEIYHFDGNYFAMLDYGYEVAGPFGSAVEAAEWRVHVFDMDYDEDAGTAGSIHYGSEISKVGRKLISKRLASQLFETLTACAGTNGNFYWGEAPTGKLYKDPFHDASGKALQELHEAQKGGVLDAISAAELKLKAITKKERADDYVLGEEAKHFTSAFDSYLLKLPLCSKGKLARFSAEWVRICLPRRIGKKTLATVIRIENPSGLIDDLVPVTNKD
jgi:hypothetical protein